MKKFALILLICVYSLATMGFSIHQFLCCGKLKSVSITLAQDTKNGNEKSGCCSNKYQFFKVKDNHFTADDIKIPVKQFINLHLFTSSFQEITFVTQKIIIADRSNAPPLNPGVPAYIYNCVFRI